MQVIEDLQYVGAMNHPGAGKNDIPNRLKRHFFIFNMIVPPVQSMNAIFGKMVSVALVVTRYMLHHLLFFFSSRDFCAILTAPLSRVHPKRVNIATP